MAIMQRFKGRVNFDKGALFVAGIPQSAVGSTADTLTAHSGGGKANALVLTAKWNRVTTVTAAADSVLAPPAIAGSDFVLVNDAATNSLTLFGAGTDTIDGVATGTGNPMGAGKRALFRCFTTGQWRSDAGAVIS